MLRRQEAWRSLPQRWRLPLPPQLGAARLAFATRTARSWLGAAGGNSVRGRLFFAELVSISSTRSAGVSDSAYFIESIELRPTFDLFLGAPKGLHFLGRVSAGETLIVLSFCPTHRLTNQANPQLKRAVAGRGAGA